MKKLGLNKQEIETVESAIQYWYDEGLLDSEKSEQLKSTLLQKSFEWALIAKYAFWIALGSLILAVFSLFADDSLVQFVKTFYDAPNIVFCLAFAGIAIVFYFLGYKNKKTNPDKTFSSETLMLAGAFSTAASVGFLGTILDRNTSHYTISFLLSILIYGILAVQLKSKILWIFTLVALGVWFATETAYHSHWGFKFWGMNYPLRFTIFGILITIFSIWIQPRLTKIKLYSSTSFLIGLLYTMISLWALSIFGNYSDFESWTLVRQYEIFYWGLLGVILSLLLCLYGLRTKDYVARDIGFVFFILNLYTRFVEYLWDNINRTIFFLILALSFWFVGRWAEKIWKKKELNP